MNKLTEAETQHISRTLRAMEYLREASYEAESVREERRMTRQYNAMFQSIKPLLDKRDGEPAGRIAISGKADSEKL